MIVSEERVINCRKVKFTYSDSGKYIRAGRIRYKNAADPVDSDRYYFEEDPDPVPDDSVDS